jgi:hypothetical protein
MSDSGSKMIHNRKILAKKLKIIKSIKRKTETETAAYGI